MPVEPPRNIHATALLAGDCGLLITGASGAGKSTLALALIGHFRSLGLFSRLVADDQLFISGHGGRLVCQAPPTIAGLAEVAGIGPQPLAFEKEAVIDLCVRLVAEAEMQRFQKDATIEIAGCTIAALDVAARNVTAAVAAVSARLSIASFR
ncbi:MULTISPECIES: HPr kinase/phosphorylase [Phyllobacteriaceae]|uniref:Serine kinase n=1 Tax=Mesorhizobium hungaricum TaxID=1566387 RepID=A0A1C2DG46_9HYPH|nr:MULTISPECIES: HPr kinase/phosphatase C-terminal domain-containing protein [Mesorhizobium]MBN9234929.1 HPr kinase/phosphatase C-terminal domain-containing protein [Mesorhizobium sp.]MDQ0330712.1 serine kinase of HPr protein (carbohydrate metabolism regulator) [Mesorhizobium sp. YL-MeA3-2017]OCX13732.1 serine kinase [Mesorhizobium hungaricum]